MTFNEHARCSLRDISSIADDLESWAEGPKPDGMGAGLHAEKFAQLSPAARRQVAEYAKMLRAALDRLVSGEPSPVEPTMKGTDRT